MNVKTLKFRGATFVNETIISKLIAISIKVKANKIEKVLLFVSNDEGIDFVVDSGANSHMVNNVNILSDTRKLEELIGVASKKARKMEAKMVGEIQTNVFEMKNVLYVLDLLRSLMSVNALTNKECEVLFKKNTVEISKNNKVLLKGAKNPNGFIR